MLSHCVSLNETEQGLIFKIRAMKKLILSLFTVFIVLNAQATIHIIQVWDGYYQFIPTELSIQLGDTIQWLPLDQPSMVHTITSGEIPDGAEAFDEIWQAPADTFFQYVPAFSGVYNYVCTPHAESFNMIGTFTVLDGTNSVEEIELNAFTLYPNPAHDWIEIKGVNKGIPYSIINMEGKELIKGTVDSKIDISVFEHGYYILRLFTDSPQSIKFQKK